MAKRSGILCGSRRFGVMLRRWFLMVGILAVLCTLGTRCPAMSIVYSEDGEYLAHWRPDREKVSVWNLESGKCSQFDFEKLTAPYRPEWKVCVDGKLVTFDLRKEVYGTIKFWETGWSPDGRYYVLPNSRQIQDRDFDLKIWDVEAGKQIRTYRSGEYSYSCWCPDSRRIVQFNSKVIWIFDVTGEEKPVFYRNLEERNSFSAVSWSPDGRFLLVGTFGGNVMLLDTKENFLTKEEIEAIEEKRISAASHQSQARYFRQVPLYPRKELSVMRQLWKVNVADNMKRVSAMAWVPEMEKVLVSIHQHGVSVLDAKTGAIHFRLGEPTSWAYSSETVGLSPDGRKLALAEGSTTRQVGIWDLETGEKIGEWRKVSGAFTVHWTPDSRQLFAADRQQFIEHDGEPPRMGEIPKLPKVADVEYRLHFWDLETQKDVRVLTTGRVSMLPEMEKQRRELEAEAAKERAIYEERKRMQKERSPSPAPVPVQAVEL
ncbi:MAG: WD40 repeat domain-containing protein [Thermoguttaceae bacterium]|nr:WD40 repeat domain-containing protein [Thermoguttaceae bacterium]